MGEETPVTARGLAPFSTESSRERRGSHSVADRPLMRLAVRIGLEGKVTICAEADDAEQAIRGCQEASAGCVPRRTRTRRRRPRGRTWNLPRRTAARAIMLADVGNVDDMLEAIRCGAVGYVPGNLSGEHLLRIINAVLTHEAALPRSMVLDLLHELRSGGTDGLTWRESQVLGMSAADTPRRRLPSASRSRR